MDGATLTITVGPAVGEIYGNMNEPTTGSSTDQINLPQLIIAKSASPKVTSTQVTAQQLEAYILAQPGISDQLTNALKAIGDPSTTLLIPVPIEYATFTPVNVQGVEGVVLGDNTGVGLAVVLVEYGSVIVDAG